MAVSLGDGAKVAGADGVDGFLGLAAGNEYLADTLGLFLVCVPDLAVALEHAAKDLEVGQLAYEGVGGGLEDLGHQWAVLRDLKRFGGTVCFDVAGGHVRRGGQEVDDGVQQFIDADVQRGCPGEDGNNAPGEDRLLEAARQVFLAEDALFQILVGELIVGLGDGLHQLVQELASLVLQAGGEAGGVKQADDALEAGVGADGELDGDALPAQPLLDRGQALVEVGVFPVHSVDVDDAGQVALVDQFPDEFRSNLDADGSGDWQDSGVGGSEG